MLWYSKLLSASFMQQKHSRQLLAASPVAHAFAARSSVLARLASLAQIGELARGLH